MHGIFEALGVCRRYCSLFVNYSMIYISGIRSIVLKFVQNSPFSNKSTIVKSTLLMLPCKIQCLYIIIVINNKIKLMSTYEIKGMGHKKG